MNNGEENENDMKPETPDTVLPSEEMPEQDVTDIDHPEPPKELGGTQVMSTIAAAESEEQIADQPQTSEIEIPEPKTAVPHMTPQHVTIERAIISIREVENKEEFARAAQTLTPLTGAPPQDVLQFMKDNEEDFKKLSTYLSMKQRNKSMSDEELKLALAFNTNRQGSDMVIEEDYPLKALQAEDSDWRTGEGKLRASRPTLGKGKSGVKLRGAAGIAHIRNALGLASAIHIPLYNSGFYITVNAPDDWDMIELIQKINYEKSAMGTDTAGGVFSNSSCYLRRHIRDLICSKLTSHSLKTEEGDRALSAAEVFEHILITDYPAILTYIMNMKHAKGYDYLHACTNYIGHCNHSQVVTLNLAEMVVTNFNGLTDEQKEHMLKAREMGSVAVSDIVKYQSKFGWQEKRRIRINEAIDVIFKVPTIHETIKEGELWMSDVKSSVDKIVGINAPEKEVEQAIGNMIDASIIRRYAQWIERVETFELTSYDDDIVRDTEIKPNYIDERSDINEFMVSLIDSEESAQKLMLDYVNFLSHCNMTIVGYPQFTCPKCDAYQGAVIETEKGKVVKAIVPFEAEEHFFILLQGSSS